MRRIKRSVLPGIFRFLQTVGWLPWVLATVFAAPVFAEERADYYPIEKGGGATAYCFSDRGLQLTPEGKVTACVHARNAPVGALQMEGGSTGSVYCMDGRDISFSAVNGKLKSCTISYSIKGLSVSGTSIQCAPETVAQFREDGYIISCGKNAPAIAQPVPGTKQISPGAAQPAQTQTAPSVQPPQPTPQAQSTPPTQSAQPAGQAASGAYISGTSIAGWSSELDDEQWPVRNLLDGKVGAGWASKNNPAYPQTITIRIPEEANRKIRRVEINPFITLGKENWAKDVSIYVAPSNVDWGPPVGRLTLAQENEFQALEFEPRAGLVVIIKIESNWGGNNVGMGEVRVFDNSSASNLPSTSGAVQNTGSSEGVVVKVKSAKDDLEQMEAGIFFQAALVNMVSKFVDARLATDTLLKTDFGKTSVPQWNAEYDKTAAKWNEAGQAIKFYQQVVGKLPDTRLSQIQNPQWRIVKVTRDLTRGELLAIYDAAPPGMKIATVAAILNVDMNTANKILQDVREGVNKHLGNIADANHRAANAFKVLSTGSKALITVGGIAATGGGSLALSGSLATKAVAAGEIGALAVNGADLVLEISDVAVNIGVKDPGRQYTMVTAIKNAREWKPLTGATYVLTVMDLAKMFKGLSHVMDRREAWLNTQGAKNIGVKKNEYEKALKEFKLGLSGNLLSISDIIQTQDPAARFVVVPDPDGKTVRVVPMSGLVKLEAYIKESREAIQKLNLSPDQTKILENALAKYAAAEMKALSQPELREPTSCGGLGYKECRETPGCAATFSTTWYVCCNQSEAVDGFCPKPK